MKLVYQMFMKKSRHFFFSLSPFFDIYFKIYLLFIKAMLKWVYIFDVLAKTIFWRSVMKKTNGWRLLFVAFLLAGIRIAVTCDDLFGCLLAAGIIGKLMPAQLEKNRTNGITVEK